MKGRKANDLTGQRFGRLTVLCRVENKNKRVRFKCKCDCGKEVIVLSGSLTKNKTRSCGCLKSEELRIVHTVHGLRKHPMYNSWIAMRARCLEPSHISYPYYGGKGIKICDEWKDDFLAFYTWAISNGWEEGLTIDRIDSDRDYEPDNCRWITLSENASRSNRNRTVKKHQQDVSND